MKNVLLITISLLFSYSFSSAQSLNQIYEGGTTFCPEKNGVELNDNGLSALKLTIEGQQLVVTPIKCVDGKFVVEENVSGRNYTLANGISVVEKYYDFRLVVSNFEGTKYNRIDLPFFASDIGARIDLNLIQQFGSSLLINIAFQAEYKASNGYVDYATLYFGAYHLKF